jgi:hypothetical protein
MSNDSSNDLDQVIAYIEDVVGEEGCGPCLYVGLNQGYECRHCGGSGGKVYKRGKHYRLDCFECDRYIKFVTQTPSLVERVERLRPIESMSQD